MNSFRNLHSGRKPSLNWLKRAGSAGVKLSCAVVVAGFMVSAAPVSAQTVIYDGSQPLNFFSASRLTDDLALNNNPNDETRNGVVSAGADPNALEVGDAAWFRSTGRRMSNIDSAAQPATAGLAGAAVGVDGIFMTDNGSTDASRGAGAGYVLYDAGTTTGVQTLNISVYYNDATPNDGANTGGANDSGGSVSVRVWGVNEATDPANPWADDDFTFLAGSGGTAAHLSAGSHRPLTDTGDDPVVTNLLTAGSYFDPNTMENAGTEILPSADWQELSFEFDAGAGYDWLIIAVGGVGQPDIGDGQPGDRYGFDNISYEAAPVIAPLLGDVDLSGDVTFLDIAPFIDLLSSNGFQAEADIDQNGEVTFLDISPFIDILSGQ
jgi:hypothetical protein